MYGLGAIALGYIFLKKAWQLRNSYDNKDLARGTFKYSIFYMMLLCAVMVIDALPITRMGTGAIAHSLQHIWQAIPIVV